MGKFSVDIEQVAGDTVTTAPSSIVSGYRHHASMANKLLNASYDLNKLEMCALFLPLHGANSSKLDNISSVEDRNDILLERITTLYTFRTKDYARALDLDVNKVFEHFRSALIAIKKKEVVIKEDDGELRFNWIVSLKFFDDKDRIGVQYHPLLAQYLFDLGKGMPFTKFYTQNTIRLESKYSWRLAIILEQKRLVAMSGKITLNINELYDKWNIPIKTRDYPIFYRDILKKAIKELEDKNWAKISITKNLENRKVVSITLDYCLSSVKSGLLFQQGRRGRGRAKMSRVG